MYTGEKMEELRKLLEDKNVKYEIKKYHPDVKDTLTASKEMNLDISQIIKTLLVIKKNKYYLLLLSSDKKLKSNEYKMANINDIERITGYKLGAVTPIKLKNKIPIIVDRKIFELKEISIASGKRGFDILIETKYLQKLIDYKIEVLS